MDSHSLFHEELEALQAIYMEDLNINQSSDSQVQLEITLHPSTADQMDLKNVCLTLICCIDSLYPEKEAKFLLKNPRGLADAHLASIEENLKSLALSKVGEVMLFDLLEYAKESLTDNNHPSCVCPICFEHFQESEQFFKTECYHYFHLPCMKGYVLNYSDEKYVCPVCRFPISVNCELMSASQVYGSDKESNNIGEVENFVPDNNYLRWRRECEVLFKRQQQNGGIIDLEYEKNKYLIKSDNLSVSQVTTTINDEHKKESTTADQSVEHVGYTTRPVDAPSHRKDIEKHTTSTSASTKPYHHQLHRKKHPQNNNKHHTTKPTGKLVECSCSSESPQATETATKDATNMTSCKCGAINNNETGIKPTRRKKPSSHKNEAGSSKENTNHGRRFGDSQSQHQHHKPSSHARHKHNNNRKKLGEARDFDSKNDNSSPSEKETQKSTATASSQMSLGVGNGGTVGARKLCRPPPGFEKHVLNNTNNAQAQDTEKKVVPPSGF